MLKKYDIVATVGTYIKNGETKNRYKNVGAVIEKDGKPFILLDKIFNPAGLPGDKESVLLSLYAPKEKDSDYNQGLRTKGSSYVPESNLNDYIPF